MYNIRIYSTPNYEKLPMQGYIHLEKEKKRKNLSFETILKDEIKRRREE